MTRQLEIAHEFRSATVEKWRFHNGLTVLLWMDPSAPVFAYQSWFRVGSRHEKQGKTGIAHLFEHLMFKATKTMGDGEFDRVMEAHGAQTNAATWVDWTYYREKLPAGNMDLVTRLEADRMENLALTSEQLEAEREVVKNERKMRVDNDPDGKIYEELYALAFQEHMYGSPTIGWMEDIDAISLEDCFAFYGSYYAPNNAIISVVGDVDRDETLDMIEARYGHLKAQPIEREVVRVEPPQTEPRRKTLELPVSSAKAVFAWHGPAAADPSHAALEVLSEVLAGGESSRLYKRMVTDEEVATDVTGWVASWAQPGIFEVGVQAVPGKGLEQAEAILTEELAAIAAGGLTERELLKAVNGLETYFWRSIADTSSRARGLGHAETTVGDFRWFFGQGDRYQAVTVDAVVGIAASLTPERCTAVLAVPAKEAT